MWEKLGNLLKKEMEEIINFIYKNGLVKFEVNEKIL